LHFGSGDRFKLFGLDGKITVGSSFNSLSGTTMHTGSTGSAGWTTSCFWQAGSESSNRATAHVFKVRMVVVQFFVSGELPAKVGFVGCVLLYLGLLLRPIKFGLQRHSFIPCSIPFGKGGLFTAPEPAREA
jgi:hypothetical protein